MAGESRIRTENTYHAYWLCCSGADLTVIKRLIDILMEEVNVAEKLN